MCNCVRAAVRVIWVYHFPLVRVTRPTNLAKPLVNTFLHFHFSSFMCTNILLSIQFYKKNPESRVSLEGQQFFKWGILFFWNLEGLGIA